MSTSLENVFRDGIKHDTASLPSIMGRDSKMLREFDGVSAISVFRNVEQKRRTEIQTILVVISWLPVVIPYLRPVSHLQRLSINHARASHPLGKRREMGMEGPPPTLHWQVKFCPQKPSSFLCNTRSCSTFPFICIFLVWATINFLSIAIDDKLSGQRKV